ncbi:MAG: ERAP1-like C-terminal domain-containing protein, partial [Proteobacteria bacterium]|nr:ERAP1-like C-terminal domain-containing protein [Pseudomonadota bacterium]
RDARVLSWRAPVVLKPVSGGPARERLISRTSPQAGAVGDIVNGGQLGYYRVQYDNGAFAPLADGFAALASGDQLGLLQDNLALGMAGQAPIGNYLRLTAALPRDADAVVWRVQARTLAGLDGYYAAGPRRAAYRAWASAMLAPALERVGFDPKPRDAPAEALLRETLLLGLSQLGDAKVAAEATRRFKATANDLSKLSADERRWVLVGAARAADPQTFQAIRALARAAKDPLERNDLYIDLAAVDDASLASQVLALSITDEAPTNLAPTLVKEVAAVHPQLAWRFTLANLPTITRTLDTLGRSTFVPHVAEGSNDLKLADELTAYAKTMPPDARGEALTALARIRNNADIQARRLPQIDGWISAHPVTAQAAARGKVAE